MFRKVCGISLVLWGLYSLSGCVLDGSEGGVNAPIETQTEVNMDSDSQRESALGLIYGLSAYDSLNVPAGDSTDWRYIIVTDSGNLKVQFSLQSPDKTKGEWGITDAQGRELDSRFFSANRDEISIDVSRGVYFFRAQAAEGASEYTVKAEFTPKQVEPKVTAPVEEPDEEVTNTPSKPKTPRTPKPTSSAKVIKGKITNFTEKSDTEAQLKISFDEPVKKGTSYKPNSDITVTMTACSGKTCQATARGKNVNAVKKLPVEIKVSE